MFVVIIGTMFGNKTIHGPFEDLFSANKWVIHYVDGQPYEIVRLEGHGV